MNSELPGAARRGGRSEGGDEAARAVGQLGTDGLGQAISGGCAVRFAQLRGGDGDPRRVRGLPNHQVHLVGGM